MRVCLMIEGQEDVTWEQWLALADACERHGFDALFRSDHYLSVEGAAGRGALDAWTTLAGLAARTERIRLGTLVSPATFRHPSVLAKSVVTVDHISGGRVELGIGAGWLEAEHRAYGLPFAPLRTRMEVLAEQVEIVRRSWDEGSFDFDGRHYRVEGLDALPKPVQRPGPPLIIGGSGGRRSVELAARWADEYNTIFAGPERCAELRARLDVPLSLMTGVLVGADRDDYERRLEALARRDREPADTWITGPVDEAASQLRELEAAGVERVMLQHLLHTDLDAVELIGRELIPAVA